MEIAAGLKWLKSGKATGPDGSTLVYYKQFKEKLDIPFVRAFNELQKKSRVSFIILC